MAKKGQPCCRRTTVKVPACLFDYYKSLNPIEKRQLAKFLNITVQSLSQLMHGVTNLYLEIAILIVIFSEGKLTVEQLRPDMSPYIETNIGDGEWSRKHLMIKLKRPRLE